MKALLALALVCVPVFAAADYLDVIQMKLKDGCSLDQLVSITKDFNEQWGKSHGYKGEIAAPLQSDDMASTYFVGRTASAEAFGKAWDSWRDDLSDAKSLPAKLNARFEKCSETKGRRGYDVYSSK